MQLERGRYGEFLACSAYPGCDHTESLNSGNVGKSTGVRCPAPGCDGELVQRTSKRGKTFYGCSRFPQCDMATWDKPVDKPCPDCGAPFLVEKTTKKQGTFLACRTEGCGYRETPD